MSETFSCNVRTRHGETFVVLTRDAVRPNDAASGLSVKLKPRTHAPNVTEKGFFDLSVKFLLGLCPNIDSKPVGLQLYPNDFDDAPEAELHRERNGIGIRRITL